MSASVETSAVAGDTVATDEVIRTEALTKLYPGGILAVDELSLSVRRGEIFGLLGPNGAGKTTTIGMLTTRVIPTGGEAWVSGIDVVAEPARVKQLIGVVTRTNTLDRSLTVYENLFFHGRYFGMTARDAKAETNQLLDRFRLGEKAKTDVSALSGGMAQRLMVARSIMHKPAVLFLDEPTAGLDPQSRLSLWETVHELNALGQTILLTTHYMEEADQLCGRVAIMDHGRILSLDTPAGLKRSTGASTTVVVSTTGDLDKLADVLAREVEGALDAKVVDHRVYVGVDEPDGVLPRVVNVAQQHAFTVTDLSVSETTLETVFINLTGKELRE